MARVILFNKPYGVLSQFTSEDGHPGLKTYLDIPGVYAAGRLDSDSEGLLILTDDGALQHRLADPRHKLPKTYLAQVEGAPSESDLAPLRKPMDLGDFVTQPAQARLIEAPENLWIVLKEGKNRQVRRMTAKAGFPTLRLLRVAIGIYRLDGLQPGEWREMSA